MKIVFFNTKPYDQRFFEQANQSHGHEMHFLQPHLDETTVSLANGFEAVCIFVNDQLNELLISKLAAMGVRLIALRCAGFNNVDLVAAAQHSIAVVRVPAYSPYAVAEHTMALLLALNRKVHRAYNRVRDGNFALEGLLGFDIHGLTAGVIGTGKIGTIVARILNGFGCDILAYDPYPNSECKALGVRYLGIDEIFAASHIITLHCPLTPDSYHLINEPAIEKMRSDVALINTSRGALVDTKAVIAGLKSGKIGHLGLDVYEEEGDMFFEDLSGLVIQDDVFARLNTFPNVIITGHQAFFTKEALTNIAETTLSNTTEFEQTGTCSNQVSMPKSL